MDPKANTQGEGNLPHMDRKDNTLGEGKLAQYGSKAQALVSIKGKVDYQACSGRGNTCP